LPTARCGSQLRRPRSCPERVGSQSPIPLPIANGGPVRRRAGPDEENPADIQIGEVVNPASRRRGPEIDGVAADMIVWIYDEHGGYTDQWPPTRSRRNSIKPISAPRISAASRRLRSACTRGRTPRPTPSRTRSHTSSRPHIVVGDDRGEVENYPHAPTATRTQNGFADFLDTFEARMLERPTDVAAGDMLPVPGSTAVMSSESLIWLLRVVLC